MRGSFLKFREAVYPPDSSKLYTDPSRVFGVKAPASLNQLTDDGMNEKQQEPKNINTSNEKFGFKNRTATNYGDPDSKEDRKEIHRDE